MFSFCISRPKPSAEGRNPSLLWILVRAWPHYAVNNENYVNYVWHK